MRVSRTFLIIGLMIVGLSAAGVWYWQTQQQAAAAQAGELRQAIIGRGAILSTVSATGPLAAEAQLNLFFGAAGPVVEVAVALGAEVKQGDLLARLDTADLELAIQQAEHGVRSAELALAQLQAPPRPEDIALAEANLKVARAQVYQASQGTTKEQVEIARLNLVLAQASLEQVNQRIDDLIEQGKFGEKQALEGQQKQLIQNAQIAEQRYEQAQTPASPGRAGSAMASVEQAQAALDKLTRGPNAEDLQIAQLQLAQAQASLEQARLNLKDAQITAPFDGLVAAVNVRVGEVAVGALPAIVLVDNARYHLDVAVDEVDVSRLAAGQAVTVTVDALPNEAFSGSVEQIAPQATVSGGVVSYPVRVVLPSADERLRAGLTATAEIVVKEVRDVVLAPNWAIRRDRASGQAFASVLREGQPVEIPVTLGLRNDAFSEVTAGLAAGDSVAIVTTRETISLFGSP